MTDPTSTPTPMIIKTTLNSADVAIAQIPQQVFEFASKNAVIDEKGVETVTLTLEAVKGGGDHQIFSITHF